MSNAQHFVALVGGVGGAKLALGLADILPPERLTIVVNTGDDFEHLGLHVAPDLDTVMYTLAGIANPETGWGVTGESWSFLEALRHYGGDTWFRLGDRDLATHVLRTQRLRQGETLSAVTEDLCRRLGIAHRIVPMSDDPVRTMVDTSEGRLAFQDYFVRRQCQPAVTGFAFDGAQAARPSDAFSQALSSPSLAGIIIAPSNPFVSIGPMLATPQIRQAIEAAQAPIVAVSPIIAGQAVKGPAAKMLTELGLPVSALSVAQLYSDLIDGIVVDHADAALTTTIRGLGVRSNVAKTMMLLREDKAALARTVLAFIAELNGAEA
jgi:LPPG:FO 2-phospho-L-lactate transferase